MALIYPTIWEQGDKKEQLTPGLPLQEARQESWWCLKARQVTIYENGRTGPARSPCRLTRGPIITCPSTESTTIPESHPRGGE